MDIRNGFVFVGVVAVFLATACPCLDDLPIRNPTFYRKYSPRDRHNLKRQ